MPNVILWESAANSEGNVITTELNSLADDGVTAAGTEYDNSTGLDQFGFLEMNVTFGSAPTENASMTIYMVKALDGTNYEQDPSLAVRNGQLVAIWGSYPSTSARRYMSDIFPLPACKVKFVLINESGQAFPASGSTVELFTSNNEIQ